MTVQEMLSLESSTESEGVVLLEGRIASQCVQCYGYEDKTLETEISRNGTRTGH